MHIETLDLAFQHTPQTIAAYLIEGPAGMVLVETGPGSTRHTLVDHLRQRHLQPRDLQAIIVTHIHLDHAGAAGWFAQQGVPVYVHYVGAPHLIDPTRLLSSAARIYGDQMDTLWGEMLPAPADSPTTVTREASPPNAPTCARTHSSAATWSSRPRFAQRGAPGGPLASR